MYGKRPCAAKRGMISIDVKNVMGLAPVDFYGNLQLNRFYLYHNHIPESCKISICWSSTICLTNTLTKNIKKIISSTGHLKRRGGLMVSAVDSGSIGVSLSPGQNNCVVFLGKTLHSHSASLQVYTAISRKLVGKKHQSACDKTERWSGYSLEFCILA